MSNKARFAAKSSKNVPSGGSGSKRGQNPAASGIVANAKGGQIQVFHNGKIVTPQSLLPHKGAKIEPKNKADDSKPASNQVDNVKNELKDSKQTTQSNIDYSDRMLKDRKGSTKNLSSGQMTKKATMAPVGSVVHQNIPKVVEEMVTLTMSETDTQIQLSLPSLVVSSEVREVVQVEESNARYDNLLESRHNADGYIEHNTQTLNYPQKNQNEMVAPNASQDIGSQAYSYDISDAVSKEFGQKVDVDHTIVTDGSEQEIDSGLSRHVQTFVQSTVNLSLNTPGCLLDPMSVNPPPPAVTSTKNKSTKSSVNIANESSSKSKAQNPGQGGSNVQVSTDNARGTSSNGNIVSNPRNASSTGEEDDVFAIPLENDSADYGNAALQEANEATILSSTRLMKRLHMVERAVQQNAYHDQILEYRSLPEVQELVLQSSQDKVAVVDTVDQLFGGGLATMAATTNIEEQSSKAEQEISRSSTTNDAADEEEVEKIRKLFTYSAPALVRGRTVTCMAWNAENTDLLAVGYGRVDFVGDDAQVKNNDLSEEDMASGLVLFWSIRNPGYPEKVLRTPHAVTALDFSKRNTTLLAVGFYTGDIAVYDVRREVDWAKPMESSIGMPGSHSDPVWQLRWLSKGHDRKETLISISTDGNVLQWSLKKGLLVSILMELKRGGAGEGWISRRASGLCFDFAPDEHGTYITGTEEGDINRCSISYNEQYLETYSAHTGPVYRLSFSPFWGDIFLSCSADWTMSLFHMRNVSPLLTFHSGGADFSINDISWCPRNSTLFGAVTDDAKLQIWDISQSDIDPVINLDTNVDFEECNGHYEEEPTTSNTGTALNSRKSTAAGGTRQSYSRSDRHEEVDNSTPVTKLLKNLKSGSQRRTLTSLSFSANSPVMMVGDSKGVVTVYRIRDDIINPANTLTSEQKSRLQNAVWRQTDPADATRLQASSSAVLGSDSEAPKVESKSEASTQ